MIKAIECPALSAALEKLKEIIASNERDGKNTVIFCEDRLTLAAERTVCAAVGGTFSVSVYTFARFLSTERGKREGLLSSQGSAMAIRRIIEENRDRLRLFRTLSAQAAAGAVYDTIALLYASKISAEDVGKASADGLLGNKLHDIALIYAEYEKYLKESGRTDRNAYLGELSSVVSSSRRIAGSEVIFLGFQSFTRAALDGVRAAFGAARSVYGLFIGGAEEIYVNEASASFEAAAADFGGALKDKVESVLIPQAETLRRRLFDPESFHKSPELCQNVHIFEAADEEEELEFIAASIKKHVLDCGERYGKISVMLPDVGAAERGLNRIFSQYRIPYYADRRRKLSEHPICDFITEYLMCVSCGCTFRDTDAVVSSPLFPAERKQKDIYRNYALRFAQFRGGIKREPKREILEGKFDYDSVARVRELFLKGLSFIPAKGGAVEICAGVRKLLEEFGVEAVLDSIAEKFKDSFPAAAEFSARVYEAALGVLSEAESIAGGAEMPLKEFIKILKSGFSAAEISLIPPKADAVFVGDLAATANTGSDVVFAARLTGDVPGASADTALLTDREIAALEKVNLGITPKIRQVNMRRREQTALNICAFRKELYLTYPVRVSGEENGVSEIISYATSAFCSKSGANIRPLNMKRLENSERALPYFCSEKVPAMKRLLASGVRPESLSAVYAVLASCGFADEADAAVRLPSPPSVSDGRRLFVSYDSVTPTTLETYFLCPYRNFLQQGLKLQEREEGAMRPVDTGNFIHTVLQKLGPEANGFEHDFEARARAKAIAEELLKSAPYSSLADSKSGEYTAAELVKEAQEVASGMAEQVRNSRFKVESTESRCEIPLDGGIKLFGRIDRVDSYGDMVRIIDYKTGTVEASASKYYMGLKLQLPLYLLSASSGRRAAGAYYFPASVEYREKSDGVFRLEGFMDGGDDVVSASDVTLEAKKKSAYFNAYLGGRKTDAAMDSAEFGDFLQYSACVARQGAREMLTGNIAPSPAKNACKYCKMGGSCGYDAETDGEREERTVKCGEIAAIVRRLKGDK